MSNLSVLYDTPGPRARRRNVLYTVLFLLVLGLVAYWVISALKDKGQLDWDRWSPIFTDSQVWTTYLLPGLQDTLVAAALAMVIALPLGALLGIGRLSEHWWISAPCGAVVEFFRAIPVLMMMIFANVAYSEWSSLDREVRPLYAVVTGLVLYNASVLAEVVRAGVLSLPRGQTDAAKAIGMRKGQTMTNILLPQAVTAMLPAIVSQLVVVVKDTALGGPMIGYSELLRQAGLVESNYSNTIAAYTTAAAIFITLNALLTNAASRIEARIRRGRKTSGAVASAGTDDDLEAELPGAAPTAARVPAQPAAGAGRPAGPDDPDGKTVGKARELDT
ncbi:amino acid ABC transporter permease [Streptomyces sp. 7-21]|uniref:amino acid ABC transporter permease n=1 Tax=Streptomyces sp. 7-21 TaxID=2802283 RepID=UPI00191E1AA1|nr:amino acid ABC transporter permease [Streptomyces sp. 7-21]MBL1067137.1 amino acid ABC transporter permease [Streptomyces sp. 7-21]